MRVEDIRGYSQIFGVFLAARVLSALPVVGIAGIAGSRFALKEYFPHHFPSISTPNILHPTFRASCIPHTGYAKAS